MTDRRLKFSKTIRNFMVIVMVLTTFCGKAGPPAVESDAPYKDSGLPVEKRVEDLLGRMTLVEKIGQLSGISFSTVPDERLGIPALKMADGPVGVRWGFATAFPASVSIAAAWNPELTKEI
ncbi:MAG: hypothetical protein GY940_20265, partial [bacterium]|nr:hypothetical protein [bacterium]